MNLISKTLLVLSCVAIILGIVFCIIGFDKKNNYYNSENYYKLNVNSYVGGDAYNYIINGTYFAGFLALGGAMFICGCICGVGGFILEKAEPSKKADNLVITGAMTSYSNAPALENNTVGMKTVPTDDVIIEEQTESNKGEMTL